MAAPARKTKINIIYYSMYGHIYTLAKAAADALTAAGVEVGLFKVPELLPAEVLEKMHSPLAGRVDKDVPEVDRTTWHDADGFIFGIPTRFGAAAAPMRFFFDGQSHLWSSGGLVGKPFGMFTSTATQSGGQETTILTSLTATTHLGMIYVPHGYTAPAIQFDLTKAHGVSPWGVSTLAGPTGDRKPLEEELAAAGAYAVRLSKYATALAAAK